MIRTIVTTRNDADTLEAAALAASLAGYPELQQKLLRMKRAVDEAFSRPIIARSTQIVPQPPNEPARYDLVGAEMLAFTSYCGQDDPKNCTPARPCPSCLGMSNVFKVWGRIEYVRQLAPEWNNEPPPIRDDHARVVEERVRRKIGRERAKAARQRKDASAQK